MSSRLDIESMLVDSERLPSMPAVASQLLAISDWDNIDLEEIGKIISSDVSLSSKILQVVNSPFYGFKEEIATLSHALASLGLRATRSIALGFSLLKMAPEEENGGFDYPAFWLRSLNTAVAAREIALVSGLRAEEEAFLAGLLQDIGVMVLNHLVPDLYRSVLGASSNGEPSLLNAEKTVLGIDHVEVADLVFKHWNLPSSLRMPILYHHDPDGAEATSDQTSLAINIQYVSGLVGEILYASNGDECRLDELKEIALDYLGISNLDLEVLMYRVDTKMDEISGPLDIHNSRPNTYSDLLEKAHHALGEIVDEQERLLFELEEAKLESQRLAEELRAANTQLLGESRTDGLTGLSNRRQFEDFLIKELSRSVRYSHPLSILFLDVDNFKQLNDQYGHCEGDAALRHIARILVREVRTSDLVARYGGEEFIIALVETSSSDAMLVAERIRRSLESSPMPLGEEAKRTSLTISVGVAAYDIKDKNPDMKGIIEKADQAMYQAKAMGKNRVILFDACA